jgi:calcium-dependent protein kinase
LLQQIIRAVYYMHESRVVHRDLKPENFLFATKDPIEESSLKIIDFGLSRQFEKGQVLTTKVGTSFYIAPQVLSGKYDELCDLWSVGVIMFILLCGVPPFQGESYVEVVSKVRRGAFTFNPDDWKNVSEDAKSLVCNLLRMNPGDRFTAEQALNDVWIKDRAPQATDFSLEDEDDFVGKLRSFRSANKLKKAALQIIAAQLDDCEIRALRDMFVALDGNSDGLLTAVEMREGLTKAGLREIPPDLQQIMEDIDADGGGLIDYTDFLAATLDKRSCLQEDVCWSAFRIFDKNGDGRISRDEVQHVLNNDDVQGLVDARELMKRVDGNGDGYIDFTEFMAMMLKSSRCG